MSAAPFFEVWGDSEPARQAPPAPKNLRVWSCCAVCHHGLAAHDRCTVEPDRLRDLTDEQLATAAACPLDLSDELERRRVFGSFSPAPSSPRRAGRLGRPRKAKTT